MLHGSLTTAISWPAFFTIALCGVGGEVELMVMAKQFLYQTEPSLCIGL